MVAYNRASPREFTDVGSGQVLDDRPSRESPSQSTSKAIRRVLDRLGAVCAEPAAVTDSKLLAT